MSNLPIPSTWGYIDLGTCANLITKGSTPTTYGRPYKPDGIAFVRVENLSNGRINTRSITTFIDSETDKILKRSRLQANDILFSIAGTIGRTALVREEDLPANTNQALAVIRGTDRVLDPSYLSLALVSSAAQHQAFKEARGGAMNNISLGDIRALSVPVPPLLEQRRIVAEIEKQFTRLDAAVEALKRVRANLRRYCASVLKAACEGRLVPTEAELALAKGGDYEPADVLLQRSLKERRLECEAGELARTHLKRRVSKGPARESKYKPLETQNAKVLLSLPIGWAWTNPEALSQFEGNAICAGPFGTIFKARDFRSSGIPIIFLRHVAPGRYLTNKPGYMDEEKWRQIFRPYSVFGGELLVTKLGEPPGVCAIYPEGMGAAMVTPDVIKMSVNESAASSRFLMHYFNSDTARRFAFGVAFGTTRLRMTLPIFRRMPVPIPPLAEQHRIVAEVERRLSVIEELEALVVANLKRADRLRQSILKRAFEGKLVPQNPNDEPASVLLERIRAERNAKSEQ